jgi:sugar lactone lactonase YvrE
VVLTCDEGEEHEHSDAPKAVAKVLGNVEKSVWASDLSAPHGLTRDFAGNVYATEFTAGRIAKLSPDGKITARFGEGLKSPAWIVRDGDRFLVTERKANRVLAMSATGQFTPLGQEIVEPLGIAVTPQGRVVVVAHTTSRIFDALSPRPSANQATLWRNIYSAPSENGRRYGLRSVAVDRDGSLLVTDETDGKLMLISPAGRAATLTSGLDDPTGVTFSPSGEVFVAEEGAGRVSRVESDGTLTTVADGLGQPRGLVFLDARTLLVADREGGKIWRVTLPRS